MNRPYPPASKTGTNEHENESLSFRGSTVWKRLPDQYKAAKRWGSAGFAEQRNWAKICRRIRNSGNFSTERLNSSYLLGADFLENDTLSTEF